MPTENHTPRPEPGIVASAARLARIPTDLAAVKGGVPAYAGLAAATALAVLDWPVAAGIGLGVLVVNMWRGRRPDPAAPLAKPVETVAAKPPKTAAKAKRT